MGKRGEELQAAVLDIIKRQDAPVTAYDILAELKGSNAKTAPTTVYRALTALIDKGHVHRLESLNAYVSCQCTGHADASVMSICNDCGSVEESVEPELLTKLSSVIGRSGFAADRHVIEVHGTCASCDGGLRG